VAEVRKIREDYAAQFNFDLRVLCHALREREQPDPRQKVSFPPKPAKLAHTKKPAAVLAETKISYETQGD